MFKSVSPRLKRPTLFQNIPCEAVSPPEKHTKTDSEKQNQQSTSEVQNDDNIPDNLEVTCQCKRSECIKRYCECFSLNGFCNKNCKCINCKNVRNNSERRDAIESVKKRGRIRFQKVIVTTSPSSMKVNTHHATGCKCKRSRCEAKYCECFRNGVACSSKCSCENCLNTEDDRSKDINSTMFASMSSAFSSNCS